MMSGLRRQRQEVQGHLGEHKELQTSPAPHIGTVKDPPLGFLEQALEEATPFAAAQPRHLKCFPEEKIKIVSTCHWTKARPDKRRWLPGFWGC